MPHALYGQHDRWCCLSILLQEESSGPKGPGLLVLTAIGIFLILSGVYLASGNQYAHLNSKISNNYHYGK